MPSHPVFPYRVGVIASVLAGLLAATPPCVARVAGPDAYGDTATNLPLNASAVYMRVRTP